MQILNHLKCDTCGAHAPTVDDCGKTKCMTCGARSNGVEGFSVRAEVEITPPARHTMTKEQFEGFVAQRWDQHCSEHAQDFLPFATLSQPEVNAVMAFALACINDAPN